MSKPFVYIAFTLITITVIGLNHCTLRTDRIDYSIQVKPILNKNCLACHGGVKKQGGFSLLFREEALAKCKSGKYAIVPGNAAESEMIARINHHDPDERMPHDKDPLTKDEIKILTKWIDEGAVWGEHWSYVAVKNPQIPDINDKWIQNDIDKFILHALQLNNLHPSSKAEANTLQRRLALDITGLPAIKGPSLKQNYSNIDEYIDALLASNAYGEKWASMWLDIARYADTKGYERDGHRDIWRYRDWLIRAFNEDKPYDQFITEQLAGDLLENPSEDQYIATAFHRNTMTNDEGGTDNEEFRVAAVIDRVHTTWEGLMSTTFACVQCHSHPYDPFRHEEYFQFMSFFNNTRDEDTYHDFPVYRHYNPEQLDKLAFLERDLTAKVDKEYKKELILFIKTLQPSINSIACKDFVRCELSDTKFLAMRTNATTTLPKVTLDGKTELIFQTAVSIPGGEFIIRLDHTEGDIIGRWQPHKPENGYWFNVTIPIIPVQGVHNLVFEYKNKKLTNPDEYGIRFNWFYFTKGLPSPSSPSDSLQKVFYELANASVPSTPVIVENPKELLRKNHLFERGSWLSKGKEVQPGTPQILNPFPKNAPKNRLGMAQWMTDVNNPLVSRTIVNKVWEQLFGTGLVETLENIGSQGAIPSNQTLLDYLSWQLMHEYKWSIKRLIREIVSSATYQQSSGVSKELQERDPFNRLLARGPRIRLSAEQVRDQALMVSGAINDTMYGPPVMPFQPEGTWSSPYDGATWNISNYPNRYRKAIYTYWKRTSPYPSMTTFDGAGREVCLSRRIRTNTPLQALVMLNDDVYMDLSGKFAVRVIKSVKGDIDAKISYAYHLATNRDIKSEKLIALKKLYSEATKKYKADQYLTCLMGENEGYNDVEFAALSLVCNAILNLDEVLTKS